MDDVAGRSAIDDRVGAIRGRIADACARAGRDPRGVLLIGASKTVPAARVRQALAAGVTDFGENRVQELREKAAVVPEARWHFFGILQRHTVRHVAALADVVHTAEPGGAVAVLARRAAEAGRSIPSLIEVDLTGRRAGVSPGGVAAFADEVASTAGLRLAGLMTIPPFSERAEDARPHFVRLRELSESLVVDHPDATELSMGMSLDYEVAVEEGATMVRIGTALFGERPA